MARAAGAARVGVEGARAEWGVRAARAATVGVGVARVGWEGAEAEATRFHGRIRWPRAG